MNDGSLSCSRNRFSAAEFHRYQEGIMMDRASARALAEAGYMPLEEYLRAFGNEPSAEDLRKASEDFSAEAYSVRLTRPWPAAGTQFSARAQTSFGRRAGGRGSISRKAS
jgi:hypothetical protein